MNIYAAGSAAPRVKRSVALWPAGCGVVLLFVKVRAADIAGSFPPYRPPNGADGTRCAVSVGW